MVGKQELGPPTDPDTPLQIQTTSEQRIVLTVVQSGFDLGFDVLHLCGYGSRPRLPPASVELLNLYQMSSLLSNTCDYRSC